MHVSSALLLLLTLAGAAAGSSGQWSAWGPWNGDCANCPNALAKVRSRICIPPKDGTNGPCVGAKQEIVACGDCPLAASWGEWGPVDGCSVSCGGCGRPFRSRNCVQKPGCPPAPCMGDSKDVNQSAPPCDNYGICHFPMRTCCPGLTRAISIEQQRSYCANETTTQ